MTLERPHLTPRAAARLDEFENPEILGASRQLAIAADLLVSVAQEHQGDSDDLVRRLRDVVDYLVVLRGESSQAVPNALGLMLDGLDDRRQLPTEELQAWVVEQVRGYDAKARRWMRTIAAYGATLASGSERILAYDYSSSVAAILRKLGERGQPPTVVVPEARTLDGGRRYVEDLRDSPLRFELIPDAAIGSKTQDCDLALVGAETISAQGGCYNTTGTFLVALACQYWRVPFYAPTTLIKIDTRTLHGYRRPIPNLGPGHLGRLVEGPHASGAAQISISSPDLDYVPPELIDGFVTEVGVLPPAAISHHAAGLTRMQSDG